VTGERFIVNDAALRYERGDAAWELTPDRILCVGEATTEAPGGEDWLICLVTDTHGAWVEASLYAQGRNDALHWLSVHFGRSFEVKLANSPAFRSRVMWPADVLEQPLFQYQVSTFRRVFSRGLRQLGFPPLGGVQTVHPAVLDYIWRAHRHHPASRLA
jgi:hypothetical protein